MIENLLMYTCAKHCHKRWSSDKAIAKIKRCSFFCLTVYFRSIWSNDLRHVSHVALGTEMIITKFELEQLAAESYRLTDWKFTRRPPSWIGPGVDFNHRRLRGPIMHNWAMKLSYWYFNQFPGQFSGALLQPIVLRVRGSDLNQMCEETVQLFALPMYLSDFRYVALLRSQSALTSTGVENWCHISHFFDSR